MGDQRDDDDFMYIDHYLGMDFEFEIKKRNFNSNLSITKEKNDTMNMIVNKIKNKCIQNHIFITMDKINNLVQKCNKHGYVYFK